MYSKAFFVLLFALCTVKASPQNEAALVFLLIPPSPALNGAGAAGTASLLDDPYKVFFNPAHLGYSSRHSGFSAGFYPGKIEWLNNFWGMTLNSSVFNAGYNLERIFPGLPLSIGIAYSENELVFRERLFIDPSEWNLPELDFPSKLLETDEYSAYSFGIGYHTIVNISAGFTVKDISSTFNVASQLGITPRTAEVTAMDYGILLNVPLNNLLNKPLTFNFADINILTDFNYTLGFAVQNIGEKVYYIEPSQADPIGRTARLAHNIDLDISLRMRDQVLEMVDFSYSIDADDILIKKRLAVSGTDTSLVSEYDGIFGKIKPLKNLFTGKGDPDIVLHKGVTVEFLEAFSIAAGGFDGRGFPNRKTSGYGFRAKGFLKLLNIPLQNKTIKYISDHFDIRYINSTYFKGVQSLETEFQGVTISVTGF